MCAVVCLYYHDSQKFSNRFLRGRLFGELRNRGTMHRVVTGTNQAAWHSFHEKASTGQEKHPLPPFCMFISLLVLQKGKGSAGNI
jgi:hypothetical protein